MDMMTAIVIATVFCALIVSLFMVAYRYQAMSREMKTLGALLKKQIKAESTFHAQVMEQFDHGAGKTKGEGAAEPAPGTVNLMPVLSKLDVLSARLDELTALLNDEWDRQASANAPATIPPKAPAPTPPPEEPPAEPVPPAAEPASPEQENEPQEEDEPECEENADEEESGTDETGQTETEEERFDDKTAVRCPACSRQLPYDALRIQDEQTCPYCHEVFRSNSYLLALINERSGKHPGTKA